MAINLPLASDVLNELLEQVKHPWDEAACQRSLDRLAIARKFDSSFANKLWSDLGRQWVDQGNFRPFYMFVETLGRLRASRDPGEIQNLRAATQSLFRAAAMQALNQDDADLIAHFQQAKFSGLVETWRWSGWLVATAATRVPLPASCLDVLFADLPPSQRPLAYECLGRVRATPEAVVTALNLMEARLPVSPPRQDWWASILLAQMLRLQQWQPDTILAGPLDADLADPALLARMHELRAIQEEDAIANGYGPLDAEDWEKLWAFSEAVIERFPVAVQREWRDRHADKLPRTTARLNAYDRQAVLMSRPTATSSRPRPRS